LPSHLLSRNKWCLYEKRMVDYVVLMMTAVQKIVIRRSGLQLKIKNVGGGGGGASRRVLIVGCGGVRKMAAAIIIAPSSLL